MIDLKPCPFCGGEPNFSAAEWKDENRYVGMTLECCASISAAVGWQRARDMTPKQRTDELQQKLADSWNTRSDADAQAEIARLRGALEQIVAIENKDVGSDWEEIEEARVVASEALK